MKNIFSQLIVPLILISGLAPTKAWVYPEHRDITLLAIKSLSPEYRAILDGLWNEARKGFEFRLTEAVIDETQSLKPNQLDFASWPAIAGDHSTSAMDMLNTILTKEWILNVADITAQLKIDIANAKNRSERISALRKSDIELQGADPEYVTRAGSNNVHFLLPLVNTDVTLEEYIYACLNEGMEINALGIYAWYHSRAVAKISRINMAKYSIEERASIIRSALSDEAFALHFLEDVFASGHAAGTRGDASQRKGTHDYYNEFGLKVSTWEGESLVLTGDAWMREEDSKRASIAIRMSLESFLDASVNKVNYYLAASEYTSSSPEDFNISINNFMPPLNTGTKFILSLKSIFLKTPIPGLSEGLGEFPRFRAEVGSFVGFSPAMRGWLLSGGFGPEQKSVGVSGGLEVSVRYGIGLDGVLNESGDGLAFLSLGWRQDGSSSTRVVDNPILDSYGNLYAEIPGRSAFSARLRMPFYIIPGDLLILGPLLYLTDKTALTKVGVTAVNGGLIPWQAGLETAFGRFQFVLGREVAVYLYGRTKTRDALITYSAGDNADVFILSYRTTKLELPVVEYRPFRSFDTDQRSSLFIQLYGAVDFPHHVEVLESVSGTQAPPELKTIYTLGLRFVFDWRHYF